MWVHQSRRFFVRRNQAIPAENRETGKDAMKYPLLVTLAVAASLMSREICGQLPLVAESRLGVDLVQTNDGKRLYGFLVGETEKTLQFAVDLRWLEATHPELARAEQQRQAEKTVASQKQLAARIQAWASERATDTALVRFLHDELQRLAASQAESSPTHRFLLMEIQRDAIRKTVRQPDERRQIAGVAYMHDLPNINTTPITVLQRTLESNGINALAERVDLSKDLPHARMQSVCEWTARQALVEFQWRQPLEFHGTAELLVRRTDALSVSDLVAQVMKGSSLHAISQLGADLGLPEFASPKLAAAWWKSATQEAEQDGFRGLLILRLDPPRLTAKVGVTAIFLAMEQPGEWYEVSEFRGEAGLEQQTEQRLDRLRNDPQIKACLDTLRTLGLAADAQLVEACRYAAATESALESAKSQFALFLGQHILALDGPALPAVALRPDAR